MKAFHHSPIPALAAGLLALLLAPPAGAEVYKWIDDKGVVNYSSTPPPPGRAAKELPQNAPGVSVIPAPPAPPPAPAKSATDQRVDELERALATERAAREAARSAQDERAEARRRAAVAYCEENRGVDCEENPYPSTGYGYGFSPVVVRPHVKPLPIVTPPPPPKPRPAPEPRRGAVGKAHPWE